jgi:hypothetical protein
MYDIKEDTAVTIPVFGHDANGDAVTGMVDGGFTKRISKNGGAFGAMTVTITEMENGWYSVPLSASHTDTAGVLSITFTNASCKQINLQFRVSTKLVDDLNDVAATDIVSAGAITTASGAVSNVTTVATTTTNTDMRGTDSAALATVCTEGRLAELDAANLPAVTDGIQTDLDNATDGLGALKALIDALNDFNPASDTVLLADGAHGGTAAVLTLERIIVASATATEPAVKLTGNTSGAGLQANGGATGHGFSGLGGATSGDGMHVEAQTLGDGIDAVAAGSGQSGLRATAAGGGVGFLATGDSTGAGFRVVGGALGHGMQCRGGATSGDGIRAEAQNNGDGIQADGFGGGHGINATGGLTGNGIDANSGATSGDGFNVTGTDNDIVGDVTGIVSTVTTLTGHTPQTGDNYARLGAPAGASVSADVAAVKAETALIVADTAEIGTAGAGLTDLGGMSTGMQAEVNAEVADVLKTDTSTELAAGAPPAGTTIEKMILYLYEYLRNKVTQTSTTLAVFKDDGSTQLMSATVSDAAGTYTKGEFGA